MDVGLFVRGLVLGLSVAAAVGPMAILCMRRTLVQGQLIGIATGVGIATADGCYSLVAAFGLTFISNVMIEHRVWLEATGGLFLGYLGVRIATSRPASEAAQIVHVRHLAGAYGSALALTLTNPMTIVSFAVMFAGLGLAQAGNYGAGSLLVLGVFLGSVSWWLALTTAVRIARHRLTSTTLQRINILAGGAIAVFGAAALVSAIV